MRKQQYSPALATGCLAAGGTLGVLIPPSGALIVFGIIAEQSIGKLFMAAVIPGLSQALLYMLAIFVLCRWKPALAPASPRASWRERRLALFGLARVAVSGLIGLLIVHAVMSWVQARSPLADVIARLCEPILRPFRRIIPLVGGIDLSPLAVLVLLQVVMIVLGHLQASVMR